jgi:hypothetical protein
MEHDFFKHGQLLAPLPEMTKEQARREIERRWTGIIMFKTRANKGIYAVGGRDEQGVFHAGASELGWAAAFEDADRRTRERRKGAQNESTTRH